MRAVTLPTSIKHRLLLDMARGRAIPASPRAAMLERIGRSLDEYGSMTSAMIAACISTISPSS